jgi:hypothetical protein
MAVKKLKSIEDQLRDLVSAAAKSNDKYEKQIKALRKKLKKCTHKYTSSYWWESDNGYGRQTGHSSPQCRSCLKIKLWEMSDNWSDPEDLTF